MGRERPIGTNESTLSDGSTDDTEIATPASRQRPLKILRVSTDTYPEILGGGAIHAHELSRMQADQGHDVTLLTSDHGNWDSPRRERRTGYEIRRYREVARPFGNSITPGMAADLWRLSNEYDVVHAHSHLYFSTNIAAALARIKRTPLVITNHGLYSQSAPELVQSIFMRTIARPTFNSADRVLCYTETDRQRLRERGVSSPISVVHNGIDCETFVPDAADEDQLQLLFVGRLKETKGVRQLIHAFARLADDIPEVTLKIVGNGPLQSELEEIATNKGINNRVMFTGRLSNEDLPEIYSESALFVLPSTAEGFPRTVLESLACETPVVTSDLAQLKSFIQDVGETVSPKDTAALEKILKELLQDELRRQELGSTGRKRVLNNYSWSETVEQTTQIYFELIN